MNDDAFATVSVNELVMAMIANEGPEVIHSVECDTPSEAADLMMVLINHDDLVDMIDYNRIHITVTETGVTCTAAESVVMMAEMLTVVSEMSDLLDRNVSHLLEDEDED